MANKKELFDSAEFERDYHCDLPLGSFVTGSGTLFRLWAPTARRVVLNLYRTGHLEEDPRRIPMEKRPRGIWELTFPENLSGTYYTYDLTFGSQIHTAGDPYARSCGLNGLRSMVIDLKATDPEGWDADCAPARPKENIIYEVHVKDFSYDPASGVAPAFRGKFLGLSQTGTTLHGNGIHPTTIDYLKQLGVTHIELMPIYDFGSVDEAGDDSRFNWGYDPVNYNVPEGSYATDPYHGEVRIRELKQAIAALHKNGFRVIMDVVYNHTYRLDSNLQNTVPWYYYRQWKSGKASNGSGCGNDTAGERSMVGKYILDSVLYWAEEYHIDGFRFDLMGLHPVELMNRIRNALDDRFGIGEKLMLGEPWRAADAAVRPGTVLSDKDHLQQLSSGVGAFCDTTRDAIKGSLMNESARGFVNGGTFNGSYLACCMKGWAGIPGAFPVKAPSQTICFNSSHDDWTLWDRLVNTLDPHRNYAGQHPKVLQANKLAAAILFCCQGSLFMLSGEEFGRTKYGIRNTYASPLSVNRLDWERAVKNRELREYYRGLIALRKQLPGLQDKCEYAPMRIASVLEVCEGCAAVMVDNSHPGSRWDRIIVIVNTGNTDCTVPLPPHSWQLLCDGESSLRWQEETRLKGKAEIPPLSAMILGR